ncbi:MAG: hypothetical protein APR53_03230 [Methanoculleus sp. SDB]|nr:MAG: hypothetical protein APR53_03230 [Methanoculleus sp. SDB]
MKAVLIKYGELFLKSESVKRWYITLLLDNLRHAFDSLGLEFSFEVHRGRILIEGPDPAALAGAARRIFGIVGVAVCTRTRSDRAEIEAAAVLMAMKNLKPGMSFAVRARRSGVSGFTSQELAASIGAAVIRDIQGIHVDLTSPDYELFVEARDFGGLLYDHILPGPGGVPLGTQGEVLSLLSAGIDSPVASWLMMRRGSRVVHLHCDGGKWAGRDVFETAMAHHRVLSTWSPGTPLFLIVADLEPFFRALSTRAAVKNRCVICKRFMLRIASRIARMRGAKALVTGDNLGQVASQTLANMAVTGMVVPCDLPLLRPLITNDKEETIAVARTIGTFRDDAGDLGCLAVPRHPSIAADTAAIEADEEKMDCDGIECAVIGALRCFRARDGAIEEINSQKFRFLQQSR